MNNNDMNNNDINAIKRILLMFIGHIKYSGELYPFRPEEKEELIDYAMSWLNTTDPSTLTKCDQCEYRRTGLDEDKEQIIPLSVINEIKADIEGLIKTYERNYGKDLGMILGLKNALELIDQKVKEYIK